MGDRGPFPETLGVPQLLPPQAPLCPRRLARPHPTVPLLPQLSADPFPLIRRSFSTDLSRIQETMSESGDERAELNIQASSAPVEEKKAPRGVKKVKRGPMLAADHVDNDKGEEGVTADYVDPTRPFEDQNLGLERFTEWCHLRCVMIARSMPKDIIIPDPTPKRMRDAFLKIAPRLDAILERDSVACFLRLFKKEQGMHWNCTITAQTLTYIVMNNAMGCAKVALEGKKPELYGMHANPNCMNSYGYFPLHKAAEMFSTDMIKLLFRHGASANVRTVGNRVIEGLLPLHVAVQNACLHKYLEDNLASIQKHQDYIYNLIHLLCLPEMKIFLDTIRLLAEKTDNVVDEVWAYIAGKKLLEAAVLLLAAQEQIRGGCSSKRNVNHRQNGFLLIMYRINEQYDNTQLQLNEKTTLRHASLLVRIILDSGEVLDGYIKRHSKVPHAEVIQHVSSILKDFGYCSTGEGIDIRNLRPYDCKMSDRKSHDIGHVDAAEAGKITASAAGGKVARKKKNSGWDPDFSRRMFFPYWRSVLLDRCFVIIRPHYAPARGMFEFDPRVLWNSRRDSMGNGSSTNPNYNLVMLEKTQQPASNHQPRRHFTTTAFTSYGCSQYPNSNLCLLERIQQPTNNQTRRLFSSAAFTLLKLLKNA